MTYKCANSEDSSYHKRGNSAIKEVCCSPRQFSKNIWCCSATGWGVSRTFRSKFIELFKIDETFFSQLIKCNKSEFWFSSWENFFANFVRVSECCFGWMVYPNYLQTKSEDSAVWTHIFNCPGQLNRWPCRLVTDWLSKPSFDFCVFRALMPSRHTLIWPLWLIRRQGQRQRHWQLRAI